MRGRSIYTIFFQCVCKRITLPIDLGRCPNGGLSQDRSLIRNTQILALQEQRTTCI